MPSSIYDQEGAIGLPHAHVVEINDAEEFVEQSSLSQQVAENVLWLAETRWENRNEERWDVIVVFEDWATTGEYDIADNQAALVGTVDDHSEKAFRFRGGFEVDDDLVTAPREDLEDHYITEVIDQIDQTDKDFVDRKASGYWPKSAVEAVYVYED